MRWLHPLYETLTAHPEIYCTFVGLIRRYRFFCRSNQKYFVAHPMHKCILNYALRNIAPFLLLFDELRMQLLQYWPNTTRKSFWLMIYLRKINTFMLCLALLRNIQKKNSPGESRCVQIECYFENPTSQTIQCDYILYWLYTKEEAGWDKRNPITKFSKTG